MAKILVTGASGLLGANAVLELLKGHQVVGVYHRHPLAHPDAHFLQADLSEPGVADRLFEQERPDWVLHCAAAANVDECEREPEMAFRLNRDMASEVAKACSNVDARLAHISTDLVFDGSKGNYSENDPTHPINVYGRSKLAGEQAVSAACSNSIIIRTNIYGWNARQKQSLSEWFLESIRHKGEAPGFTDMYSSPILVNDLIGVVEALLSSSETGIFHVGGDGCISKHEFGCEVAQLYGFDKALVSPISWKDKNLFAERAENLCLNTLKVKALIRTRLPSINDGLTAWKQLDDDGFRKRLKALVQGDERTE